MVRSLGQCKGREKLLEVIFYNVSKEGRLLMYIVTEYFSNVIHSSEQTKEKEREEMNYEMF